MRAGVTAAVVRSLPRDWRSDARYGRPVERFGPPFMSGASSPEAHDGAAYGET
ncbi:hypothetical protein [Haloarcula onubensis]|uniref:Uncharacterized protein n=1 Tax=Haloarcula onubensis TaxID=2950539 RepID=A0ABU2FMC1_9EURY|nr:hypothetical protein [Halomicroarcula sp. S3CR25-11]MDS0281432.1 hypothetical protein [Halomicroarcula sp. S3CR25-11]